MRKRFARAAKAFAVLRHLVEGDGKLVTKAKLLRAGWADTHVTDGVIKLSILEIRRALGDDPSAPRFIETVPRRGYRLIAARSRTSRAVAREDPACEPVGRAGLLAELDARLERARRGVQPAGRLRRAADGYERFRERRDADARWANGWLFYTPGEAGDQRHVTAPARHRH